MTDNGSDGSDLAAVVADLMARYGLDAGRQLDAQVTPDDARNWLASLAAPSRLLLGQALALYLVLEEIPPVSLPLDQVSVVLPLLEAGLVYPVSERDQHRHDGPEWGVVPGGQIGVGVSERLIGLVLALIVGEPQDGWTWVSASLGDYARLRQYPM